MSFIEVESWEVKPGHENDHDEIIKQWFLFVEKHHDTLFSEWKSARYFRQVDSQGVLTGRYIMNFEFHSIEGHDAYKERRKNWDGPYETYKSVDPYEHFIVESVELEYWEPQEQNLWLDF